MLNLDELNIQHKTRGLLFVGDPHIWSHKPGRRRDDYLKTICNKLEQIVEICNKENLWPVFLGDLFHQAEDNNLRMISAVSAIFQKFHRKPIVLVGNHDLTEQTLTQGTVLEIFHGFGTILTIMESGPFASVSLETETGTKKVMIGGTPYGQEVPKTLAKWFKGKTHEALLKSSKADTVIWITHDDYAFDNSYPNAVELHPILGVDMVINGHIHKRQAPIKIGQTAWYNPGNIARISIDLIDQEVAVWAFYHDGSSERSSNDLTIPHLKKIPLQHDAGKDVMSLEGRFSKNITQTEITTADNEGQQPQNVGSLFVAQLKEEEGQRKTDEGVMLRETLNEEYELTETPEHIKSIVEDLFRKAVLQHQQGLT